MSESHYRRRTANCHCTRVKRRAFRRKSNAYSTTFHSRRREGQTLNVVSIDLTKPVFSNPRTQEEDEKTNNVWMKGHAGNSPPIPHVSSVSHWVLVVDHISFTAIWSQPVTALQIKDWDGQWRYVRHVENALVS